MSNLKKATTKPSFGQWTLAGTFLGLAVAGAGGSLYINYTFGKEIDPIAAGVFTAAEVGLFVLPLTKATLGWNARRRVVWLICLGMSLMAASFHLLQIFEDKTKELEGRSAVVASAKASEQSLRAELARITEDSTVAALKGQHTALQEKADAEVARGNCDKTAVRKVFNACMADKAAAGAMLARVGAAERRDELTAKLASATDTIATTPEKSFGGAGTLAKLTGYSESEVAAGRDIAAMGGMILLLVMLSSLSGDAGEMLKDCMSRRKAWKASQAVGSVSSRSVATAEASSAAPAPSMPAAAASKPQTVEDDFLSQLQMMIYHSPDQKLRTSIRKLAMEMKVARGTLQEWMNKWRDEGKIAYWTDGNSTIFELPKAA